MGFKEVRRSSYKLPPENGQYNPDSEVMFDPNEPFRFLEDVTRTKSVCYPPTAWVAYGQDARVLKSDAQTYDELNMDWVLYDSPDQKQERKDGMSLLKNKWIAIIEKAKQTLRQEAQKKNQSRRQLAQAGALARSRRRKSGRKNGREG